ncbi:hypothetical protein EV127DRAFT_17456 [Xylaria flabelliformis]|nr:hypothetical protein EV127DRAFT_17456 [Xylaria flabelliformis]
MQEGMGTPPLWEQCSTPDSQSLVLATRHAHSSNDTASQRTKRTLSKKLTNGDYSVGWIAAVPVERAAAEAMLDDRHQKPPKTSGDINNYTFGEIGDHNVVIASLPHDGYGTINAAIVASNMRRSFPSLEVFLMVGIAGGAPVVADVRLGDVVVSTKLVQYDLGKSLGKDRFETTAIPLRPSQELRMAVAALQARHEAEPSRIPDILSQVAEQNPHMENYASREFLQDLLFESAYEHPKAESNCSRCDKSRLVRRTWRRSNDPMIHYGVIASGNQVIKHATTRDKLAQQFKALCFEMEGAGFIENLQCLVVRCICDYADSHKNKQWQRYAAATAAAYAKELLGLMPIVESQASNMLEEELSIGRKRVLLSSFLFESMYSREWSLENAHSKTCEWILQHPTYSAWLDDENYPQTHGFLWIRGKPGAGKSTLMKFISKHVSKNYSTVISFFFNARGRHLEKSVEGMYRSLLHQLLEKVPDIQLLDHPHLRVIASSCRYEWTIGFLRELFSHAIAGLGQRELICTIDALDECDMSQVWGMVKHFESLGALALEKKLKLFICFSSRHYPALSIKTGLKLVLEDEDGHRQDLKQYVTHELNVSHEEDALEIRTALLQKAAGVFMWVVLVVRILNEDCLGGRMFGLKARLDEIPSELHALFRDMLRKDHKNWADLLLSIQWILYAKEPLKPEEYYYAMAAGLNPGTDFLAEWDPKKITMNNINQFVLSSSKGLAEVSKSDNPRVQFIHETVRDFLIKDGGIDELQLDFETDFQSQSHNRLKECCYVYVRARSFSLEKLDFGLDGNRFAMKKSTNFPFLKYATTNVLHHANVAAVNVSQQDFLKSFDLRAWIRLRKLFRYVDISYDYTLSANIFYVLADQGHARLIDDAVAIYGPMVHVYGEVYQYPLFAALCGYHNEAADAILRAGNLRASDDDSLRQLPPNCATLSIKDYTPLTLAADAEHMEVLQLLLDQGLTPNIADPNGWTPLAHAVMRGSTRMAQLLLDRGAEVNSKDKIGRTPLFIAAENRDLEMVWLLLNEGADVVSEDEDGKTPLLSAAESGSSEIVQLLLDKGAEVDSKDETDRTPLFYAARNNHLETVQLLLDEGAEVDLKNKDGDTLLFFAIRWEHLGLIRMLVDNGADVNLRSKVSGTPLTKAVGRSKELTEVTQLLLTKGADAKVTDNDGRTPLRLAVKRGHKKIQELLRAYSN